MKGEESSRGEKTAARGRKERWKREGDEQAVTMRIRRLIEDTEEVGRLFFDVVKISLNLRCSQRPARLYAYRALRGEEE